MPGREWDLLRRYPRGKRDPAARAKEKTAEDVAIARQFGREFFDGERRHGYGGYSAAAERWRGVVEDMVDIYSPISSVLDVGCAKGGMLQAFKEEVPGIQLAGCDISEYAVNECPHDIALVVLDARYLRRHYKAKQFSLVVSINTIHNLDRAGCIQALREIQRVGHRAYVTVDTYSNEEERQRMFDWNLTAQTILPPEEWVKLFAEAGYTGDYGWWVP